MAQFVTTACHDDCLRDHTEAVIPRSKPPNAKISNVKPIRVISVRSLASDPNGLKDTTSLGSLAREESSHANQDSRNLYGPGSNLAQEAVQTSSSGDSELNIASLLNDQQTHPENTDLTLNQALDRIKELEKSLSVDRFGLHRYSGSDEKILF